MVGLVVREMSTLTKVHQVHGVFQGGGVWGSALVGAVAGIEEQNISFCGVAGSSAGAIVASLIAAGYSPKEMLNLMLDKDFSDFKDAVSTIPLLKHLIAWYRNGYYKGDEFHQWIKEKLSLKVMGCSNKSPKFKDLAIPLTIIATDITHQEIMVLSTKNYPDMRVADAVRMSIGIPGFFCPVRFAQSLVVDGGVISNFPAWIFREQQQAEAVPILGLRFEQDEKSSSEIKGLLTIGRHVIATAINVNAELQMADMEDIFLIDLPTLGVNVTDFDISSYGKEILYKAGRDRAKAFFASTLGLELKQQLGVY